MAFHAKDGWYFERNPDASVTIKAPGAEVSFDAGTWASIIASVSALGEENYRFFLAEIFHAGTEPTCRHILGEGFVGTGNPCGLYRGLHGPMDGNHRFTE